MNEHREPSHPMSVEVRRSKTWGKEIRRNPFRRGTSCPGVDDKYGQRKTIFQKGKNKMNYYEPLETNTLQSLMEKEFMDKPHLVDTILPGVGLYLLAGDPKSGKSWLALDLALR